MSQDQDQIDGLCRVFFSLFDNRDGKRVDLSQIHDLFIPEAQIIKNLGGKPEVYTLQTFMEPREKLLNHGNLKAFCEEEVTQDTRIFGGIAQRFCRYRKWGVLDGVAFEAFGWKTIQFIKTGHQWKISSLAWDDEA